MSFIEGMTEVIKAALANPLVVALETAAKEIDKELASLVSVEFDDRGQEWPSLAIKDEDYARTLMKGVSEIENLLQWVKERQR